MFCLLAQLAEKMKKAFKEGRISPERLNDMTSKERRDFLAEIVGVENAKQVNLLFAQKLLLKNQERAMVDWAKEITGLSAEAKANTLEKIKTNTKKNRKNLVFILLILSLKD